MAVTGTGPTLGALTNGANAASAVTWGSGYATDTGTLAPESKQIRRGTNPWRAVAATELVTTGQTVQFREVVCNTDFVGQAFETDVITVGAAAITAQTAYFGTSTVSGQGGFKPVDSGGVDMDVLSIVSGGATSPVAQVVDGRLSFAGTGAPNGAVIRVETAEGEVDVTIATVAGKSIADPQHIAVALEAQEDGVAPIDLMLRPGAYDINAGGASSLGIFQSRTIPEAAHATIKPHPLQVSRPYFWKPDATATSNWYNTSWITIEGCDFAYLTNRSQMINSGKTSGDITRTRFITLRDVEFYGPRVPDEDLYDPNPWPAGYTGILGIGPKFNSAYNITLDNVRFHDIQTGGDYNPENLLLNNVTGERIYFDFIRLASNETPVFPETPCVLNNVRATGFFAINNEMEPTTGNLEPHNDVFQVIGGQRLKYLVVRNCYSSKGPYRGSVTTSLQQNATMNRALYHECALLQAGVSWGRNDEGAEYNIVNQCTFAPSNLDGSTNLRFGTVVNGNPKPAIGEIRIRNTYVGSSSVGTAVFIDENNTDDPATIVNENSHYPTSTAASTLLQGPANPGTFADILTAAAPQIGSILDTNGIGALTTAGAFRGTEIPPMCGVAPSLGVSGSDVIITPSTSLYYDGETAPTVWEWRHRTGDGAAWSSWTEETGATATATGLADTGRRFMYRWKAVVSGVAGVASDVTAVA